ncbi:MAG: IS200/IS605 family transposase [Planctomycetota bacterium]|jgi:REP element-mobilizing transposase RayT
MTKLLFHCVFSTKDRRPLLRDRIDDQINRYMAGIVTNHGAHLIRSGGTADHRHLLLELKPATNVSDVVRVIKANSSKWLHETWPEVGGWGWQTGYAAFSVSQSLRPKVVAYIDNQQTHHRQQSFDDELARLLKAHGLDEVVPGVGD